MDPGGLVISRGCGRVQNSVVGFRMAWSLEGIMGIYWAFQGYRGTAASEGHSGNGGVCWGPRDPPLTAVHPSHPSGPVPPGPGWSVPGSVAVAQ